MSKLFDNLDADGNQLKNVGNPIDSADAVNLQTLEDLELIANTFYSFNGTSSSIGTTYTDIPIAQTIIRQDSFYNVIANTELEIAEAGDYTVSFSNAMTISNNSRTNAETAIFVDFNDGGGYLLVEDSVRPSYHRVAAQGRDTATMIRRPFVLDAGARIKIAARRLSGGGNLSTIANQCSVSLERLPTQSVPKPVIISATPPDETFENDTFTYQSLAIGQGITWSLSNEPSGMVINPLNGLITYTPTSQGTFTNIEIIATNPGGTDTLIFDLDVVANPVPIANRIDYFRVSDITASAGDFISSWSGSDSNLTLLQGTAVNQPQYIENVVGTNPALSFTGNQFMTASIVSAIQPFTFVAVAVPRSNTRGTLFSYNGSTSSFIYLNRFAATDLLGTFDSSSGNNSTADSVNNIPNFLNNPHVFVVTNTGAVVDQRVDAVNQNSYNEVSPSSNVTDFIIGSISTTAPSFPLEADYLEFITYNRVLTAQEITDLETYLISKYGI